MREPEDGRRRGGGVRAVAWFTSVGSRTFVRLVLALSLITGIPTWLLGQLLGDRWEARTLSSEDAAAEAEVAATARELRALMAAREGALRFLGASLSEGVQRGLDVAGRRALSEELERVLGSVDDFDVIYVADARAVPLALVPSSRLGGRDPSSLSYADRDYFQELSRTHKVAYSRVQKGKISGVANVHIGVPLLDARGALVAFVSGGVRLDKLRQTAVEASARGVSRTLVIDQHEQLLIDTTGRAAPLTSAAVLSGRLEGRGIAPGGQRILDERGEAVRVMGTTLVLGAHTWRILSLVPMAHVDAEVAAVRGQARVFTALAVGLAIVFSALVSWWLTSALREATTRAEQLAVAKDRANEAKSRFLAHMSHEIRTPLNAVLGFAQVLARDGTLSREQAGHVDTILRSGTHLLRLINDVLELSKIEAGEQPLSMAPFDLRELLEELRALFAPRVDAKGLRLVLELDGEAPASMTGDETCLRRVLLNLLGNALKFTDRGQIELRAAIRPVGDGRARVRFSVHDTGVGLAAEDLERIFEAFQQTAHGAALGGTGLGLAISRSDVRRMGGRLEVTSRPGAGSEFSFELELPAVWEADGRAAAPRASVRALAPEWQRRRVLVVDDVPTNRAALAALLQPVGFLVDEAVDGLDAIRCLEAQAPDLILLDDHMPRMSGTEFLRWLRARPERRALPVIAVTASAFAEDARRLVAAGADAHVSKPWTPAGLFMAIEAHTPMRFQTGPLEPPPRAPAGPAATLEPALARSLVEAIDDGDMARLHELLGDADLDDGTRGELGALAERFDYDGLRAAIGARSSTEVRAG
jgi:signal transduction histidine kinase/ActR/RegA family two-component response regulator